MFALNPVSLLLLLYTWSESLMMLAVAGALLAIQRCVTRPGGRWTNTALLAGFLIVGGASRYFFAPFMAVLAAGTVIAYGRAVFIRALPGFVAGAMFAGVYQVFNRLQTGYATGIPRVPAPESAAELIATFAAIAGRQSLDFVALLLILATLAFLMQRRNALAWQRSPEALLLVIAGFGYLALAFLLRFFVLFDPYNARTVGPGFVLLGSGLAAVILARDVSISSLRATALTAAALVHAFLVTAGANTLGRQARYVAANGALPVRAVAQVLDAYGAKDLPPDTRVLVSFGVGVFPEPMRIGWNDRLYYPAELQRLAPPWKGSESAEAFAARLEPVAAQGGCYFDFAIFKTETQLRTALERDFDAAMAARLKAIARPLRYVPCRAYLGPD